MEFCIHFLSFSCHSLTHSLSLPHTLSLTLTPFLWSFHFVLKKLLGYEKQLSHLREHFFDPFLQVFVFFETEKLQNVVKNVSVLFSTLFPFFLFAARVVSLTNTSPFISACITLEDLEHLHHNKMTHKITDERKKEKKVSKKKSKEEKKKRSGIG